MYALYSVAQSFFVCYMFFVGGVAVGFVAAPWVRRLSLCLASQGRARGLLEGWGPGALGVAVALGWLLTGSSPRLPRSRRTHTHRATATTRRRSRELCLLLRSVHGLSVRLRHRVTHRLGLH